MVASPTHDGKRAIFTILGYCSGYRRVSPWVSLWSLEALFPSRAWTIHFPLLEPSISIACVALSNPTRQRTKGLEETKQGSKKGKRETERDNKEIGPWPANHNPQLGYHPSRGKWTPAHYLHKKSFFKVCNGVSLFNFPHRFTQSGHPFQFLWRLTYWSLHRDFWPLHIWYFQQPFVSYRAMLFYLLMFFYF